MAVELICPECGKGLGKDVENPKLAWCDRCDNDNIKNPRGYDEDDE